MYAMHRSKTLSVLRKAYWKLKQFKSLRAGNINVT